MKSRRNVFTCLLILLVTALLPQFQNCGSTSGSEASVSSGSGDVRLVDEYGKSEIQFIADNIELADDVEATTIDGFCSREHTGELIDFKLFSDDHMNGPVIGVGQVVCQSGQFRVPLGLLQNLVCGEEHLLLVEAHWGHSSFARVKVRCEPPIRAWLDTEGLTYGTRCSLESWPGSSGPEICQRVCSRDGKIVFKENRDAFECSNLDQ